MEKWKFITAYDVDPFWLMSAWDAMLSRVENKTSPPTVVFSTLKNSLLIARAEPIEYVNLEECEKRGITVTRGLWKSKFSYTWWRSNDVLCTFTFDEKNMGTPYNNEYFWQIYWHILHDILADLGLSLEKHGVSGSSYYTVASKTRVSNDYTVDRMKIGSTASVDHETAKNIICGLVGDFDVETFRKITKTPQVVLRYLKHNLPMTSLNEKLGYLPHMSDVRDLFFKYIKKYLGHSFYEGDFTTDELNAIEEKKEYFENPEFIAKSDPTAEWYKEDVEFLESAMKEALKSDKNIVGETMDSNQDVY